MSGVFVAIVGPSGVGKDTLLDHARHCLREDDGFFFPRRVVTRSAQAGGEVIDSLSRIEFDAWEHAGSFALSWRAHGLSYGLRSNVIHAVRDGRAAVANISRAALPAASRVFRTIRVVHVTAPPTILAARLAARGREAADDIVVRAARFDAELPLGLSVTVIDNGGSIEEAQNAFLAALMAAAATERSVQPA